MRAPTRLVLLVALLLTPTAFAQGVLDDATKVKAFTDRLETGRKVVDRVVVCFDGSSFLREIVKWDAERYWPVLLWESDLVPKFVEAFRPKEVLLAKPGRGGVDLDMALRAVTASWGAPAGGTSPGGFVKTLRSRKRAPMGVVLLAPDSPELLGGAALAAGRMHVPISFPTKEKHGKRLAHGEAEALRASLRKAVEGLDVAWKDRLDDLDLVTVANDMPFAYTMVEGYHPGAYTIDDAIARHDDFTRWGWVGRLTGGPERSVYMAMGGLFLQPETGLFFSRYAPNHATFGQYDPKPPVLDRFRAFFETEAVRHPDATLAKWREVEWPEGNRFGFVFVNSSGGARNWSTSKGGATHFDVPDSVPTIVHYTHSGSAGRPFDTDSIAGRWMANGAYVYFGSHAEPYLTAFVTASQLAKRVDAGIPLGIAWRHLFTPRMVGQRMMKDKLVRFNLSGPWKLAYFGDPAYRLRKETAPRVAPEEGFEDVYASFRKFGREKSSGADEKLRHALATIGVPRLDPGTKKLVNDYEWGKVARLVGDGAARNALQREMVRVWVAWLRANRDALYDPAALGKRRRVPRSIQTVTKDGAASPEAGRLMAELAKEVVAGIERHAGSGVAKDPAKARWVLEVACGFVHAKGYQKQFFAWVKQTAERIGVPVADLRASTLKQKWVPDAARKAVEANLK